MEKASYLSLNNISLKIKKGECVLFCGKSGSGKTTATRLFNGIIPNFYDGEISGEVLLDGQNILEMPMYEISKKVGSVFQNPKTQFYTVNTTSEIAFACENYGLESSEIQRRIDRVVDDLKISYLLDRNIFNLSGGEKQILAFASIYALGVEVYVLDEPSSNLDINFIKKLREIIRILKAQGKTIIIAEHRLYYLKDLVDRVIYFEKGEIKREYSLYELSKFNLEQHISTGIRMLDLKKFSTAGNKTSSLEREMEIKNLTYFYKKSKVLSIDNLSFNSGGINAIIGANGAGKSTFAKVVCGLLKNKNGLIYIDGHVLSEKERLKESYIVMQEVNHQLFTNNVKEEITLGNEAIREEEVLSIADRLNIDSVLARHPMTLSGGQKQRLVIASALACDKKIIFLDEPTSGLDLRNMMEVCKLLEEIKTKDCFVFIISHDFELILSLCDNVVHMEGGSIKEQYKLDDLGVDKLKKYFIALDN